MAENKYPKYGLISAFLFPPYSFLSFKKVKIVKPKRKYCTIEYAGKLYDIPKSWLVDLNDWTKPIFPEEGGQ